MTGAATPVGPEQSGIGGGVSRPDDIGGFEYAGGSNSGLIFQRTPLIPGDTQGIALDPLWTFTDNSEVNDTEGPAAQFYNGGVMQPAVSMDPYPRYVPNDTDMQVTAWASGNDHVSPYQVDTNMTGPVTGQSEGTSLLTLQPDYTPQGQYGAATGGGTSQHETTVAYYISQTDQVQREYSATALFASI